MDTSLNIIFYLAMIIALTKGAGLFLRQHQKKYVQDLMETLTLRLEEIRPIIWLKKQRLKDYEKSLALLGLVNYIITVYIYTQYANMDFASYNILNVLFVFMLANITIIVLTYLFTWFFRISSKARIYILAGHLALYFNGINLLNLVNFALASYNSSAFVILNYIFTGELVSQATVESNSVSFFLFTLTLPLITTSLTLVTLYLQLWGSVLVVTAALTFLEGVLKILRALVWRIVEYESGAFSAMIAILVVAATIGKEFVEK